MYRVDETVRLTTDAADTFETEVLTGEMSMPALGLTTLRLPGFQADILPRRNTLADYAAVHR